ncbi:MAG: LamG-like jellyroll fold domain-containing protein, partial [Planctomycetota bacterium]
AKTSIDGSWHHFAVVFDATAGHFTSFFDGHECASPISGNADWSTGGHHPPLQLFQGYGDGWAGDMDEFRVYARALNGDDIAELMAYSGGGVGDIENLAATAVSHESVQLTWDEVANADSYTVIRSLDDDFDDTDGDNTVFDNISTNSFTDTGLDADTQYFYQVDAIQN